jgi:hypothetical protein
VSKSQIVGLDWWSGCGEGSDDRAGGCVSGGLASVMATMPMGRVRVLGFEEVVRRRS